MIDFWSYDDDSGEDEVILEFPLLYFLTKFSNPKMIVYSSDAACIDALRTISNLLIPELREWLDEPCRKYLKTRFENAFHQAINDYNRYVHKEHISIWSQAMMEYCMHMVKMRIWMSKPDSVLFKLKFC